MHELSTKDNEILIKRCMIKGMHKRNVAKIVFT